MENIFEQLAEVTKPKEVKMLETNNNRLIVDFMGLKPTELDGRYSLSKDHCACNETTYEGAINGFCKMTKYHTDWNWLMQVVRKIREIDQSAKGDFKNNLLHYQRNNKNIFDVSILEGQEYVYKACVEFIKWYNLNKNK